MALVIEAIQAARLRLRDTETGETLVQDVREGAEWVCVEPASAKPAPAEPRPAPAEPRPAPAEPKPAPDKEPAAAATPAEAKPAPAKKPATEAKAAPKSPPKKREPKVKKRDLSDPKVVAKFEKEILAAVRDGARTVRAIGNRLGADPKDNAQLVAIVAALQKHIDAGVIVQRGTGAKATYLKADAPPAAKREAEPPVKVEVLPRPEVKLEWTHKIVDGRSMKSTPFDGGYFFLTRRLGGSDKLTYEKGEVFHAYGCGEPEKMKALAQSLARGGVPSPEVWIAQGGDIEACARITRMEGVELEWREKVDGGRQICLAASGDGEFRLASNDNGSFVLAFIRKGDPDVGNLGCGTREALEARALDIAGQLAGPAIEESPPSEGGAESPASQEADDDLKPDAAKDTAIMDAFERSLEKLRRK